MARGRKTPAAAGPKPTATLYAVRKRTVGEWAWEPSETGKVEKLFADKSAAEECRGMLEASARAHYAAGSLPTWEDMPDELAAYTALPPPVIKDWLADAGLTPPKKLWTIRDLLDWWDGLLQKPETTPTADQQARIWEALNVFRFYEVVELGWVQ